MTMRELSKYYMLSPAGAISVLVAVAVAVLVGSAANASLGALSGLGALIVILLAGFFSGLASGFALGEKNRRIWLAERALLEKVRQAQARLCGMRIADPGIKKLAETVALKAGEYYAACVKQKTHDPLASFAAEECLELLDVFLTELDETSSEKRFDMADANPFADARERISAALNDRAAIISKSTLDILGGLSAGDRLEIKEQLR